MMKAFLKKMPAFVLILAATGFARSAFATDYSLCFVSLPAEYSFYDSTSGPIGEQKAKSMGFDSVGLRVTQSLNQNVGVFDLALEAGFGLPSGDQSFSRQDEVQFPPAGSTKNDTNEGDYYEWKVTTIPLFLVMRVFQPAPQVGFAAQLGAGPMLVSVIEEDTESVFNAAGDLLLQTTQRRQFTAAAFATEMTGGITLQASNEVTLRLMGGLIWISDIAEKTVRSAPSPLQTSGISIGGIGYVVRAAISAGI